MMTLDTIMENMPLAEREIIMDKMVKASRDIFETIADMGYIDQYETSLTAMEKRGYQDELGRWILIKLRLMDMSLVWILHLEFWRKMKIILLVC